MCRGGSACGIGDEVGHFSGMGGRSAQRTEAVPWAANEVANSARRVLLSSRERLVSQIPSTSTCMLQLDTNRYITARYYSQRRSTVQE